MIKTTIGHLLDGKLNEREDTVNCIIYMVRDGELIFYIGKSESDVITRLLSHLGYDPWGWGGYSTLGQIIKENLPESREWQIELMSGEDCMDVLEKRLNSKRSILPDGTPYLINEHAEPNGYKWSERIVASDVEGLECKLIAVYRPCLNSRCNSDPTPLPKKYQHAYAREPYWEKLEDMFGIKQIMEARRLGSQPRSNRKVKRILVERDDS